MIKAKEILNETKKLQDFQKNQVITGGRMLDCVCYDGFGNIPREVMRMCLEIYIKQGCKNGKYRYQDNYYPREFNYCGGYLLYREFNVTKLKHETFQGDHKLNIDAMPYGVAYANDTFFYLNDYYKKTLYYSADGYSIKNMPFRDSTTGEQFIMENTFETTGGAYYVDKDGSLYVIAETEKRDIYALVRITRR